MKQKNGRKSVKPVAPHPALDNKNSSIIASGKQRGLESGVEQEDLIIPRAKLMQALSPELAELPNLKTNCIINSLTKELLPETFIPIFMFKNYIKFNPRKKDDLGFDTNYEPGALIWRTNDPLDPRVKETKFGDNGELPTATTFINFFSYFPGVPMPIIISFSKTSYKVGKQLLSLAKFSGGDLFSRKYKLTSVMESNDVATYAIFKVAGLGAVSNEEYQTGEDLWNNYSSITSKIQVHDEQAHSEPEENRPY